MAGCGVLLRSRFVSALLLSLVVVFSSVAPASAVTGGGPDNGAHPQVAFILAPDVAFCSGSLISPTVVLTAGHCTSFFSSEGVEEVLVSFDDQVTGQSTFFASHEWYTHPDYVDADWPFTFDFGVLILDEAADLPLASLPEAGLLDSLIPERGASQEIFVDVGYGQTGVTTGGGPPQPNFPLERRQSSQKYHPGKNDMVGVIHGITDLLFMLKANPSSRHGSGCGGDSGGPIFWGDSYTLVAIHTGGYRLGFDGALCGRLSSLNHRLDTSPALDWLYQFV
jgi:secreted trypsin-like serine protease